MAVEVFAPGLRGAGRGMSWCAAVVGDIVVRSGRVVSRCCHISAQSVNVQRISSVVFPAFLASSIPFCLSSGQLIADRLPVQRCASWCPPARASRGGASTSIELTPRLHCLIDAPPPLSGSEGAELNSGVILQIRRGLGSPKGIRSSLRVFAGGVLR